MSHSGKRAIKASVAASLAGVPYRGKFRLSFLLDGGSAAVPSSLASTALGGLSAVGSGLLLRELAGGLAADEEDPREEERAEGG